MSELKEAPGSSAMTAKNVIIGAAAGAGAVAVAVATAPFWAPVAIVGSTVAIIAGVGVPFGAAAGGALAWMGWGKK